MIKILSCVFQKYKAGENLKQRKDNNLLCMASTLTMFANLVYLPFISDFDEIDTIRVPEGRLLRNPDITKSKE